MATKVLVKEKEKSSSHPFLEGEVLTTIRKAYLESEGIREPSTLFQCSVWKVVDGEIKKIHEYPANIAEISIDQCAREIAVYFRNGILGVE